MKTTPASRAPRKALSVSFCVLALVLLVAPTASAGVLDQVTPAIPPVLEGNTGSSGDSAPAEQDSGLGGAVAEVVTAITESAPSGPTNVIEEVVNSIDESTAPVKEAVGKLGGTVGGAAAAVTTAAQAVTKTVRETADKVVNPKPDRKHSSNNTPNRNPNTRTSNNAAASEAEVLGATFADALQRDAESPVIGSADSLFGQPAGESLISQIGRIAAEAAQQVAFPMLLTLLVGGFLFAQNRIDRSDPKLALAPVESEHDLLSFS